MEPVPASSEMDSLLANPETIHYGANTCEITDLGREKKSPVQRSGNMGEKQPCRHQGQWRRSSRHWSRDFPATCGKDSALDKFMGDFFSGMDSMMEQGKSVRSPPIEKEGAAQKTW
ncbi:hypothetical protein BTVI_153328 [Pitangus sulphuratus]|nr:hypothetical protein BTVI_153328 [Pitangus sulphuratus]